MMVEFDTEFARPLTWAKMYRGLEWQCVPAHMPSECADYKRPTDNWKEYEHAKVPDATAERWWGPGGKHAARPNMGIICGAASGGVFSLDTDIGPGKDGEAWWQGLLAVHSNSMDIETPTQRTGGGGLQRFFKARPGYNPPTFKTAIGVDSRGQGGFAMLPPSKHASGQEYAWLEGLEPWVIDPVEFPAWAEEALEKLRLEYASLAGQGGVERVAAEVNAFGLTVDGREDRMFHIIWGVCCDLRRAFPDAPSPDGLALVDEERERAWGLYLYEVKSRLGGDTPEEGLEREGRGRTAFITRWVRALAQWNGKLREAAAYPKPNPRPKPAAEPSGRFDPWAAHTLPGFPLAALTLSLRAYVEHTAASLGADINAVAMAALTALAGGLDQRWRLKMRRTGEWHIPPRLWTLMVGSSGVKKTPILNAVTAPLVKLEQQWRAEFARDYARYKEAKDGGQEDATPPPDARRLILNDTTVEAAGAILARQDSGALVIHDELSGFIGSLDRYSNSYAAERGFWLKSYDGGPRHVDRRGRDQSFTVENLCVGFLAGIQPARLQAFADLTADGLLQRFNPVMTHRGGLSVEVENDVIAMRFGDLSTYLSQMKPVTLRLSPEGLAVADEFRRELHELEDEIEDDDSGFCSWVGKLPGTHGSICLVLHLIEHKQDADVLEISADTASKAADIVRDFLIPHARAFYGEILEEGGHARRIASYLLTAKQERFTFSNLKSNVRGLPLKRGALDLGELLAPFIDSGWLIEDGEPPYVKAWVLGGWVRELFAERRETELCRKAKIVSRFTPKGAEHAD